MAFLIAIWSGVLSTEHNKCDISCASALKVKIESHAKLEERNSSKFEKKLEKGKV